jgi:hypothetical protein
VMGISTDAYLTLRVPDSFCICSPISHHGTYWNR